MGMEDSNVRHSQHWRPMLHTQDHLQTSVVDSMSRCILDRLATLEAHTLRDIMRSLNQLRTTVQLAVRAGHGTPLVFNDRGDKRCLPYAPLTLRSHPLLMDDCLSTVGPVRLLFG